MRELNGTKKFASQALFVEDAVLSRCIGMFTTLEKLSQEVNIC